MQKATTVTDQHRPQALIHKRILDAAETCPNASIEKLAEVVSGATPELVERVLDQYGDPGETGAPAVDNKSPNSPSKPLQTPPGQTINESADGGGGPCTDADSEPRDHTDETGPEAEDTPLLEDAQIMDSDLADDATDRTDTHAETDERGREAASLDVETTDEALDVDTGGEVLDVESTSDATDDPDDAGSQSSATVDRDLLQETDLTEKQLETLEAIYDNPAASQREIAETLDVNHSTITYRVNSIEGLSWDDRKTFVRRFFEEGKTVDRGPDAVDSITARLERIERRLEEFESDAGGSDAPTFSDPELVHKVLHACMEHDAISEEEEVRVLSELTSVDAPNP